MQLTSIIKKSVIISAVVVLFIFGCGGSFNPSSWKNQIERRANPDILIQPEKVASFYAQIESSINGDPEKAFEYIESEILYTSDFFNHASLDHLPTAEEVLRSGQDDCDGQAVLLCSVLRYAGYDAYVIIGPSHAWVEVNTEDPLFINSKGGTWFLKFNESHVEWRIVPFILLIVEEFLFLAVFFSVLLFTYEKGVLTYLHEIFSYVKYVLLFFCGYIMVGILVLYTRSTVWILGLIGFSIGILLIMKLFSIVRR
ncbi:MAG: transglutaminase domain-containing protein [Theionarchaea archaeon]|nr:MAG: hypothetical protein AYK18_02010 [Theionarchaea archaeon DG-70]MBU7011247.1 transglutaminase domain-containing protein [Theionarchaea archaeon]